MTDVLKDRQEEEEFFRTSKPPELPTEVIRRLQLHLDSDGDLIYLFENGERRYAVCVVLVDNVHLGWKECQAINDAMKLASRGTHIDNPSFLRLTDQLKNKYGKVQDPNVQNGRLTTVVYPGQGSIRRDKAHTILHTSLSFDRDNDIVFAATTSENKVYRICLELTLPDNRLLNFDCKAFIDILTMLETGDCLSPNQFLACGALLREKYNFVTPSITSEGRHLSVTVLASRIPNTKDMPSVFAAALSQVKNTTTKTQLRSEGGRPDPSGPPCPYPGIRYVKAIKEGGQGQVYAGRRDSGEKVAVKVFLEQEGAAEAYKTELRMLLKMSRHQNVVEVLDFFEMPSPALVMRLIDGEDLMDYLRNNGPCAEVEGRKLAVGIAEGLCHLHRHGVIHRDFKSANIIRQRDGVPVIIDLGLGSVLERHAKRQKKMTMDELCTTLATTHISERTSAIRGSFPWMAPEMITDQEWSEKTDVYAFGIIMWEIFSGETPFVRRGEDVNPMGLLLRIAKGERPPLSTVKHVSSELRDLMVNCWDASPKKRPTMRRALDMLSGNDPRRIFQSVDRDGSGELDFGEFVMFLQRYAPGKVPVDSMAALFFAIDKDQNGGIGVEEFEGFWRQVETSGLHNVVRNSRAKKFQQL